MNKLIILSILMLCSAAVQADATPSCAAALANGDYAKAIEVGRNPQGFTDTMCLGKALRAQGKYNEASQVFTDVEKTALGGFEHVMVVIYQARTMRDAGQSPQAMSAYQRCLELATKENIRQGQLVCLNEPGQMLLDQHDPKAALTRFQQASPLIANDNERAEWNELQASAYRQMADYDHAIEHQLRATTEQRSSGDLNHYVNATLELAAIRTDAKDYNAAQRNLDEALDQAKSANSDYWQAKTLLYQGRLEKAKGNASQAQTLFTQSSELANKAGEPTLISDIAAELKQSK
jgi:tetratricopeptide (TPR) repeat protein